jgi:DNA phosphorothioation-associated putative methyltransferase
VLGVDAIPVALGIYFVFRDEAQAEAFRASRFRSRATAPRIRLKVSKFEEYRELLQPLMDFYTDRGRLPRRTHHRCRGAGCAPFRSLAASSERFNIILQGHGCWGMGCDRRQTPQ